MPSLGRPGQCKALAAAATLSAIAAGGPRAREASSNTTWEFSVPAQGKLNLMRASGRGSRQQSGLLLGLAAKLKHTLHLLSLLYFCICLLDPRTWGSVAPYLSAVAFCSFVEYGLR